MLALKILIFILLSISEVDTTIWFYLMNLGQNQHLFSSYGKWEFKRCPFGLAQALAYFQRLVNEVLSGLTFTFAYLDAILVFNPNMETHLEHLRVLFERLWSTDLKA